MVRFLAAGGITLVVLAACMADVQDKTGGASQANTLNPQSETACSAVGGTWGPRGLYPAPLCTLPNPDAGQSCQSASDCIGVCLAETRTCASVRPIFGCYAFLDEEGREVTMCAD